MAVFGQDTMKTTSTIRIKVYETMAAKIPICTLTTLWAGWSRVSFTAGARAVALLQHVQTSGAHKAYSMYTKDFSLGVIWSGHQVYHSLASSAEGKNSPIILQLTPKNLQVMERGEFNFTLISRDDGFCPPSPLSYKKDKRYNILCQLTFIIDAFI